MRRISRYVFRETLGPLTLGFSVYTFILLVRFLFQSAEMIIRRGVSAEIVGKLLLLTLPNIVVLTVPMALLFGILTAVGRLSADSELVALRASGVSLMALYWPILLLSALLTVVNGYISVYALPQGNAALQQLRLEIFSSSVSRQVEPRVFYEEWEDKVIYVFDRQQDDDRWHGVFLAQSLPSHETEITVAEWGEVTVDETGEKVVLVLTNATTHQVDLNEPKRYKIQAYNTVGITLEDSYTSSRRAKISSSKGLRELTLAELRRRMTDPTFSPEVHNLARVEIHKKFVFPTACLVFGLFGLPLGFSNRRGSRASGFALSLLVILGYYILISNFEEAARYGKMAPWAAMWMPNALFTLLGLFLLTRRNRDKSLMLSRIDRWIRQDLWGGLLLLSRWSKARAKRRRRKRPRRPTAPRPGDGRRVRLRIPRMRLWGFSLVDRYTLRQFATVFLLVLLSVLSIYIIADLTEKIDEIMKNRIHWATVLQYYQYLALQIFYDLAPIVMLLTTLITFSLLSRANEVTAAKALGLSLYRLSLPVILASFLVAFFSVYLQSEVLPVTNQRAQRLEDRIRDRETPRTYRRVDRWLFGQGGYIFNYLHYDSNRERLQRLQVFEFNDRYELVRRLAAEHARYDRELRGGEGGWWFADGWVRVFRPGTTETGTYNRFIDELRVDYTESPGFFDAEIRSPEQMGYAELQEYIEELEVSGQRVPELKVELYNKIAFPVTSVVMALVALPFAFRLGRQGTLYGIGLSLVLGMVFVAVHSFFAQLGAAEVLPPAVAVWSPSAVFSTLAGYLFLGVRT